MRGGSGEIRERPFVMFGDAIVHMGYSQGAGATSTNHGRLRCGTWNFPYADPAETRYPVAAGAMMRGAIGVAEFQ
ncbi:hypothetical protein [Streptomyces sp. NBC_00696]|uniref:hypothetical protein n=1 Tax=Streptomyces sp. NBC_00696 TaxID=2903672 RepID=UPI002E3294FC|nr:hypothetical protein [Streptomyces sp. NBC_00696]